MDLTEDGSEDEGEKPQKRRRPGGRKLAYAQETEAQRIARRLRTLAEGPPVAVGTWLPLLQLWDIDAVTRQKGSRVMGSYVRDDNPPPVRYISWNECLPEETQSRILVHELAHFLHFEAEPFFIFDTPLVYRYEDENGGPSHRIACRVERLILG